LAIAEDVRRFRQAHFKAKYAARQRTQPLGKGPEGPLGGPGMGQATPPQEQAGSLGAPGGSGLSPPLPVGGVPPQGPFSLQGSEGAAALSACVPAAQSPMTLTGLPRLPTPGELSPSTPTTGPGGLASQQEVAGGGGGAPEHTSPSGKLPLAEAPPPGAGIILNCVPGLPLVPGGLPPGLGLPVLAYLAPGRRGAGPRGEGAAAALGGPALEAAAASAPGSHRGGGPDAAPVALGECGGGASEGREGGRAGDQDQDVDRVAPAAAAATVAGAAFAAQAADFKDLAAERGGGGLAQVPSPAPMDDGHADGRLNNGKPGKGAPGGTQPAQVSPAFPAKDAGAASEPVAAEQVHPPLGEGYARGDMRGLGGAAGRASAASTRRKRAASAVEIEQLGGGQRRSKVQRQSSVEVWGPEQAPLVSQPHAVAEQQQELARHPPQRLHRDQQKQQATPA